MHGNPMNIPPLSIAAAKAALIEQYADATLRRHGVRAGREHLGEHRHVEARTRQLQRVLAGQRLRADLRDLAVDLVAGTDRDLRALVHDIHLGDYQPLG